MSIEVVNGQSKNMLKTKESVNFQQKIMFCILSTKLCNLRNNLDLLMFICIRFV